VPARLDAVDQAALLGVLEALAGQLPRIRPQRPHLRREPGVVAELGE
jgi:hypothetical protein